MISYWIDIQYSPIVWQINHETKLLTFIWGTKLQPFYISLNNGSFTTLEELFNFWRAKQNIRQYLSFNELIINHFENLL